MSFIETDFGFEFRAEKYLVFFGKKDASIESLESYYPNFQFKSLHQKHTATVLETRIDSSNDRIADAHWTREKGLALVSKSADCMPVLAFDETSASIVAIHAGWRGVQKQIVPLALKDVDKAVVFIGPHILQASFDIKVDCLDELKKCTTLPMSDWFFNGRADLYKMVLAQLLEVGILPTQVENLLYDTKSDLRFHSFRRDAALAGRQNSFIVML